MSQQSLQQIEATRLKPSKVLVLGSTGMVGRSWVQLLESQQIEHAALARPEFDLADPSSIHRCVHSDFDLVVNAAAWTDVDGAESDEPGSTRANARAVQEIAIACKQMNALLITYSTDYVFSGNASSPYTIDHPIHPINAYGRSKALGESLLHESQAQHILIRTSWVYAPWGKNFVRTIRNLAQSRNELQVVNDQRGRPTSAQQLAHNSMALYLNGARGTWHLSDDEECSWFDFATAIASHINPSCTVHPCPSSNYPSPAKRPAYSTLNIEDSTNLIGTIQSWRDSLHDVLKQLDAQETAAG